MKGIEGRNRQGLARRRIGAVAAAALVVVLVPGVVAPVEVGTNDFRISDMGPDGSFDYGAFAPAVAYNSTNDLFLVVWRGDDNTAALVDDEFEIFGQLIDAADGAEIGADFRISDMGPDGTNANYDAFDPAVAYNPDANEFLVVWAGDDDTAPLVAFEFEIFGQRLNGATGAEIGADFRISDMGPDGSISYNAFDAAVAYNPTDRRYLVVWEGDDNTPPLANNEIEIFGHLVDGPTGSPLGADFRISDMGPNGSTDYRAQKTVVAYNSADNEFLVVWQGDDNTPPLVDNEVEIFGQRLNGATGAEIGGDVRISDLGPDGDADYDAFDPAVAYNPDANEYLVVWEGDDDTPPLVDDEFEIFGQRLEGSTGAERGQNDFRISDLGPDGSTDYLTRDVSVAYHAGGKEYLVVWHGDDNTPPLVDDEFEIFGQRLEGSTGAARGQNDFRISDMGPDGNANYDAFDPAVAVSNPYLVVWAGDDNTLPLVLLEFEIFGQLWANGAPVAGDDPAAATVGQGGTVTVAAPGVLGNDTDPETDALTAVKVTDPANGAVTLNPDGSFTYTHDGSATASDSFTYRANDGAADSGAATVTITVNVTTTTTTTTTTIPSAPAVAATVGLVDPAQGRWHLRNSAGVVSVITYGNPADVPVMGDWDCDGVDTPGLFRTSDAFAYLRNSNTTGIADVRFFFGDPADVPLAGDWNGDGCDTLSIYRPGEQRFYIVNALGANEGGLGPADFSFGFGNPGDKPVVGDWDGDGVDEVGLHRESTGFFYWRDTLDTGIASGEIFFGDPGDRFVAGDWGIVDGRETPAVFRPSTTTFFFRHTNTQGVADAQFGWGQPPWLPVAGKFGLG